MDALDGNAIAGALYAHFGTDLTAASGRCRHCGTRAQIAELAVYARAPGVVVRCRACGGVVIVVVEIRGASRVELTHFELA